MTQREFIKLYAEVKPKLVKSLARRREDAEDIVQQTALELLKGETYTAMDSRKSAFMRFFSKALLLRVRRFKSIEYAARRIQSEAVDVDALLDSSHPLTNPYPVLDVKLDVHKAIAELPESVGVAVRLVYIEGHTLDEAAEALGVPMRTLQKRIQRAMPLLRELLKEHKPAGSFGVSPDRWSGVSNRG